MPSKTEDLLSFIAQVLSRWPSTRTQIRLDGEVPQTLVDRVRVQFPGVSQEVIISAFFTVLNEGFTAPP